MVKHTQTIHRQKPTNCLNVFDHFIDLAFKRVNSFQANAPFQYPWQISAEP